MTPKPKEAKMSEKIVRYGWDHQTGSLEPCADGAWVDFADYTRAITAAVLEEREKHGEFYKKVESVCTRGTLKNLTKRQVIAVLEEAIRNRGKETPCPTK